MRTDELNPKPVKMLFIGNSHTYYNDMPKIVAELFAAAGMTAEIIIMTQGGKGLIYHCDRFDVKFNVLYGKFDYIIMQDKATNFSPVDYASGAEKINSYIKQTESTGVYYMTWSNQGKPEEQEEMTEKCIEIARMYGGLVAPIGLVWQEAILKGINLYSEDGIHAAVCGSYLAAATILYTVSGLKKPLPTESRSLAEEKRGLDLAVCTIIHEISCARSAELNF